MTLAALKDAIEKLPDDQKAELACWLASVEHRAWDAQITRDFSAGGAGMDLLKEVDKQIRQGNFKPLE